MLEKIKLGYNEIKQWFWALPMWQRAILSSFIGAIGGSSIIGFFNKYALYYHAICQDFRVPVEGVEYIDLAITLVSFAFVFISIIGSITIYSFLNLSANFFSRLVVRSNDGKIQGRWKSFFMIFQIILAVSASSLLSTSVHSFVSGSVKYPELLLGISIVVGILSIGYSFSKSESSRKILTLMVVLVGVSLIILSLFNQNVYQNFLRKIQYGGEIPIEIEYRKADNTESNLKGLLLIRTSRSITIKNLDSQNISEVPIERVSKIIFLKE